MRRVLALVEVARRAEALLLARDEDMTPRDEHAQKLGEALDALEEVETDEETMARLEANLTEARAQPAAPSEDDGTLWTRKAPTEPGPSKLPTGVSPAELARRALDGERIAELTAPFRGEVSEPAPTATAGEYEGLLRDLGVVAGLGVDPSPGLATRAAAALRKVLGERDELEQRAKTWSDAHDAAEERLRSANRTWLNRYEALEAALARLDAAPAAQLPTPTPANVAAVGQLWVHPELGLCEVTAIERDADGSSRVVFGEREFCCTLVSGETLFEHGLELIPDETQAERCARASRDFAVDMMGRGLSMTDDGLRYQLALLLRRTEDAGRAAERERIRVAFANCDAHCRSRMAQDIIDNVPRVNDLERAALAHAGANVAAEPVAAEPAAEGRPCPVDVHEVGWEAECGLGYEVVEGIRVPDLHEVNLMAQVILWLVDEVRRLGGGGK